MQLQIPNAINEQEKILKIAQTYCQEVVSPQAEIIDRQPERLKQILQEMGERSLLGLEIPKDFGGTELDALNYHQFQLTLAQHSGALAFLQTQHQSAAAMLASSDNLFLKRAYLPHMTNGEVMIGVGFSQLRRYPHVLVTASETRRGYLLEGEVPWITGFGFFKEFIIGAHLADGREIYGIVPLKSTTQKSGGSISLSEPMQLAAMAATNTVSAKLHRWLLEQDSVLSIQPVGAIHEKDRHNVLHHGFFALGCAQAGVNILENNYYKKKLSCLQEAFLVLNRELNQCRNAMFAGLTASNHDYEQKLKIRAWAIELAGRCSQAAVAASGGVANSQFHAAQRVYREALLFTVSGQTTDVMQETLKAIASSNYKVL